MKHTHLLAILSTLLLLSFTINASPITTESDTVVIDESPAVNITDALVLDEPSTVNITSTIDRRQAEAEAHLCYTQSSPNLCLVTSYWKANNNLDVYAFRSNCAILGYKPNIPKIRGYDFFTQLRYSIVFSQFWPDRPYFFYAGKLYDSANVREACHRFPNADTVCRLSFNC